MDQRYELMLRLQRLQQENMGRFLRMEDLRLQDRLTEADAEGELLVRSLKTQSALTDECNRVAICNAGQRVSLYASSNDRALWVSKLLHWGPRAGDSGADLVACEGIDTIDASQVDSSLLSLRHSYFSDRLSVLTDLAELIRHNTPPAERPGLQQALAGQYWVMQP